MLLAVVNTLLVIVTPVLAAQTRPYPQCKGPDFRFDGYTYTLAPGTSERIWSHCSFPNPRADHARCGRTEIDGQYFLCDPDRLIWNQTIASQLEDKLTEIRNRTSTMCRDSAGVRETFRVAVALVHRMYIPELNSPQLCTNECGRLQPALNVSSRQQSQEEIDETLRVFADGLRALWKIGTCGNDVIVVYCQQFDQVYVSAGSAASSFLPPERVADLQDKFRSFLIEFGHEQGLEEGLSYMLGSLKVTLQGLTPAHIMLITNMALLGILGVLMLYYVLGKKFKVDVWGNNWRWPLGSGLVRWTSSP
ncbi:hypothetical protein MAR_009750 [Mya arenaria]|uniref:Uncharacterized protein n=2 Tax=Mya arenaria TaxID=6604 RepID=A0ABY7E314_MYAAR|nr:hypothetical protein MAR_009750 [Mya arenaria]